MQQLVLSNAGLLRRIKPRRIAPPFVVLVYPRGDFVRIGLPIPYHHTIMNQIKRFRTIFQDDFEPT